jgi:glycerol-3-phosphate dehydrogenase (NAD(P)+)
MRVSVIGAGSFGTAIAQTISSSVSEVFLFGRDINVLRSINKHGVNQKYHPFIHLNPNIRASPISKNARLLQDSDLIVFSVPSGVTREVTRALSHYLEEATVISTAKGVECPSRYTMSKVITDETNNVQISSFSGPTFADELIQGVFSCATLGIDKQNDKNVITEAFGAQNLLLDSSHDVEGVELCGILKNIYAIATGIFDATVTGNNQHYAFLSLCFKEMGCILEKASSDRNLVSKFCAHGDLHLTANSDKSRNRILGFVVGKLGIAPKDVKSKAVVEGVKSAKALQKTSDLLGLDTPIISFVNSCFDDPTRVREYVKELLSKYSSS